MRVGVEETIGDVDVFVSGGPALARIVNSVTDTDYSREYMSPKRICAWTPTTPFRRGLDGSRMG